LKGFVEGPFHALFAVYFHIGSHLDEVGGFEQFLKQTVKRKHIELIIPFCEGGVIEAVVLQFGEEEFPFFFFSIARYFLKYEVGIGLFFYVQSPWKEQPNLRRKVATKILGIVGHIGILSLSYLQDGFLPLPLVAVYQQGCIQERFEGSKEIENPGGVDPCCFCFGRGF
jgi:hypothetical protein